MGGLQSKAGPVLEPEQVARGLDQPGLNPSEDGDGTDTQADLLLCLPHRKAVSVFPQPKTLISTYT